jgi:hypothetical protein
MKTLTRSQVRQALNHVPIDQILSVSGELTHKQKTFAKAVANGANGAEAYRQAYNTKAKPKTQSENARRMKTNTAIQREIEAYRLSKLAREHRTAGQLRDLVIHSLVQVLVDPEAKDSTKVQASKVLGTVVGVDAFIHRTESHIITSSIDARTQLMNELKRVLNSESIDVEYREADTLIEELAGEAPVHPPPLNGVDGTWIDSHSIPDNRLSSEIIDPPTPSLQIPDKSTDSIEKTPPL